MPERKHEVNEHEWESPRLGSSSRRVVLWRLAGCSYALMAVWVIATKVTGIQ